MSISNKSSNAPYFLATCVQLTSGWQQAEMQQLYLHHFLLQPFNTWTSLVSLISTNYSHLLIGFQEAKRLCISGFYSTIQQIYTFSHDKFIAMISDCLIHLINTGSNMWIKQQELGSYLKNMDFQCHLCHQPGL